VTSVRNDYIVYQYTIGANGALTPMTPASVPAGSGPRQITLHPSGSYAYVACYDLGTISQYTIDPNSGGLTPMAPITAGLQPFTITVHPSGQYAYVPNSNGNNVSQFTVDPNSGALTPMSTATVVAGLSPVALAVDPSGKYAYVTNGDKAISPNTPSVSMGHSPPCPTRSRRVGPLVHHHPRRIASMP